MLDERNCPLERKQRLVKNNMKYLPVHNIFEFYLKLDSDARWHYSSRESIIFDSTRIPRRISFFADHFSFSKGIFLEPVLLRIITF